MLNFWPLQLFNFMKQRPLSHWFLLLVLLLLLNKWFKAKYRVDLLCLLKYWKSSHFSLMSFVWHCNKLQMKNTVHFWNTFYFFCPMDTTLRVASGCVGKWQIIIELKLKPVSFEYCVNIEVVFSQYFQILVLDWILLITKVFLMC